MGNKPQTKEMEVSPDLEKMKASKFVKAFKNIVEIKESIDKFDKVIISLKLC